MRTIHKALIGAVFAANLILLGLVAHDYVRPASAQIGGAPSVGGVVVVRGIGDPTGGAGVACPRPCLYARFGTDELYFKTGAAATAWSKVALNGAAGSFTDITATGRITGAGFSSTIAGTAGLPAYKLPTTGNGMFEDGTTRVAVAVNSADKAYWSTTTNHNYQSVSMSGGLTGVTDISMGGILTISSAGYIVLTERAAPGAAAADTVRIYAVVDGGSKTDAAAVFQSGAAQVFAQEP